MTTISAKVIADSIGEAAPRLTTLQLRYPRFLHSEVMTHRVFSRNARSSRAVPIETMIKEIETDPVIPLHWGAAQKGMQAERECEGLVRVGRIQCDQMGDNFRPDMRDREAAWLQARDQAVRFARAFAEAGYHKQVVNRLLEPFMHIDVLVTATEWSNFFALRDHPAAEPHIRLLAVAMREAMAGSEPKMANVGDWHAPYVDKSDDRLFSDPKYKWLSEVCEDLKKVSVARCARISYKPFDGEPASVEADIALAEKLASSGHWSPFEHQATPDDATFWNPGEGWANRRDHGNFVGWRQNRRIVEREMAGAKAEAAE